jgi:hypothetical protein
MGANTLILLEAEVGGSGGSDLLNPLKTKRRRGGAEVPHTPYALPRACRARSASGSGGLEGAAP